MAGVASPNFSSASLDSVEVCNLDRGPGVPNGRLAICWLSSR